MKKINDYIGKHEDRFLSELFDLLRIPSVSADPMYTKDVAKAADFLKQKLIEAGVDKAEIIPTAGHPILYGEKIIDPNLPTVMVYGHYDVQPADPLELWTTPPYEPEIRDGKIYARGACDDKGQMYMHFKAFEFMMQEDCLPCNVKFMIEGEEEVGSKNLETFVRANIEKLASDVILISDTGMIANDVPSVTIGLRGLSYMEVEVTGPNRDLHSGLYGGAVANPINALSKMIASLQDENNKITIPGFYDNVEVIEQFERDEMAKAPFNLKDFENKINIPSVSGEAGYSTNERASIRPTLDVNGMWGGYIGEGAKTVLPSKAYAKISMRLVPHQTSEEITKKFQVHFESIAPEGTTVKVTPHHGGEPYVSPINFDGYEAAKLALEASFGKSPIPIRSGGSIPIVPMFEKVLGTKSILLGFGLDTDAIHSPNENFGVFNFLKGIETIPYFYKFFTELKTKQ